MEDIIINDQPETETWESQMVLVPVRQLLHWQRSEVERREWAARNAELKKEIERLREAL